MIEYIRYIKYSSSFKKDNYAKMAQFNCGDSDINILHSVPSKRTLKFYEKMGMKYFTENENVHNSDFSKGCIPMYLEI